VAIRKLKELLEDSDEPEQELEEDSIEEEDLSERYNLLEKYGLREMDDEDVDELLGRRNGNSLNNKEIESLEIVLAKKIYHAIMSMPTIKKAAVEVFIENDIELYGIVNIIVEYEPKGFLNRIIGTSNNDDAETIEVTQIEIIEIFEDSPEIVENFEINVESF
jgi:hypothetical protein